MKMSDLDELVRGDIIVFSGGVNYDPILIGYNDGDRFEFISVYNESFSTTINLKGIGTIGTLKNGHIHRFTSSIVKYMDCKRISREYKLNELGI